MRGFIYFFKFSWSANKKYIFSVVLKTILSSLIGLSILILPQYLIDSIITRELRNIIFWTILVVLTNFLGNIIMEYFNAEVYIQKNIVYNKFQLWFAGKQADARYEYIERDEVKTLYEQGCKYIYGFQGSQGFGVAFETFFELWGYIFIAVSVAIMIAYINIFLVMLIVVIVLIVSCIRNKVNKLVYQTNMEKVPFERKENYFKLLFSDYRYGKEIRLNNLKEFFLRKYDENLAQTNYYYAKNIRRYKGMTFINLLLNCIQDIAVYAVLIYRVLTAAITIGNFTMYLNAINKLSSNLVLITRSILKIKEFSLYYDSFEKYLNIIEENSESITLTKSEKKDEKCIEFQNVYFKYADNQEYVLKNINLKFEIGKHIAIVGNNGSGKSTLIKLLLRLYKPTSGRILLNGEDIQNINKEEYLKRLAVVFQDYKLFPLSLKENIVFGEKWEKEDLDEMLKNCELDEFLGKCEQGLETPLSREFDEKGIEPSGGEGQKICLVRALCKGADILILDEPTAALDPRAEFEIFKLFKEAIKNKTAILISHRLGMAKLCDKIIVLWKGEIVEEGTHETLMDQKNIYYELYIKQALWYK